MDFSSSGLQFILRSLSNQFPSVRKLPINQYKRFNNACGVINRVSTQLVEEKYRKDKNNELNGKDLLSLLINTNKTLPVEEKMTDDELKYQVIKPNIKIVIKYIFILIYYLLYLDYDIYIGGT